MLTSEKPNNKIINKTNIDVVMSNASTAFEEYKKVSPAKRAVFLEEIAKQINSVTNDLIKIASIETNLPPARLQGEITRTIFQLHLFADLLKEGSWIQAGIDTALPDRKPLPKTDLRKMLMPIGPIIVFGASNFPFAYSTAGGDTASALATGCSVVVKAHPAHLKTSIMVSDAIKKSIENCNMPQHVFQHVIETGNDAGQALVQHSNTAGVGFTGSLAGGKALLKYAQERENPIPVFAEMGSTNPVIFLPETLKENKESLAKQYAFSITQSMGQFCTNPGLLIAIDSADLNDFIKQLGKEMMEVITSPMLHEGIQNSYEKGVTNLLAQKNIELVNQCKTNSKSTPLPTIATVDAETFLNNHMLGEEIFGPFSLVIRCKDIEQVKEVWKQLKGQLTTTIIGTDDDLKDNKDFIDIAISVAGRIIINGVPTGVEVCASMIHGGPYPATTDSRFTSVGSNAVYRWVRPVCFQNFPQHLLPEELKDNNPLNIWRMINNEWTKNKV